MLFRVAALLAVASAQVRLPGLVGDTSICAVRGERAVVCGSDNPERPDLCCDGLICSTRSGGNLHMRCWTCADLGVPCPDTVPPPAPSSPSFGTPAVGAPTFGTPPVIAPPPSFGNPQVGAPTMGIVAPQPTLPLLPDGTGVCAGEGERSQQCGAGDTRPFACCAGFVCTPGNAKVTCTAEENLVPEATCAEEGGRAMECGASSGRPPLCCEGLVCVEGVGVKCVSLAPPTPPPVVGPTATPTPPPTHDPDFCAKENERAQDCGSGNTEHPNKCCPGLICRLNDGGANRPICVEPPFGYIFPTTPVPTMMPTTAAPTAMPVTTRPTIEATPEPTPAPVETEETTTLMPTDEPTLLAMDGETSSAFGMAVAYRFAVIGGIFLGASMLLL